MLNLYQADYPNNYNYVNYLAISSYTAEPVVP
jgi:hypothetical protein